MRQKGGEQGFIGKDRRKEKERKETKRKKEKNREEEEESSCKLFVLSLRQLFGLYRRANGHREHCFETSKAILPSLTHLRVAWSTCIHKSPVLLLSENSNNAWPMVSIFEFEYRLIGYETRALDSHRTKSGLRGNHHTRKIR